MHSYKYASRTESYRPIFYLTIKSRLVCRLGRRFFSRRCMQYIVYASTCAHSYIHSHDGGREEWNLWVWRCGEMPKRNVCSKMVVCMYVHAVKLALGFCTLALKVYSRGVLFMAFYFTQKLLSLWEIMKSTVDLIRFFITFACMHECMHSSKLGMTKYFLGFLKDFASIWCIRLIK